MSGKYLAGRDAFGMGALSWTYDTIRAQLVSQLYGFDERHGTIDDVDGSVGVACDVLNPRFVDGWAKCDVLQFQQVRGDEAVAVIFYRESDGLLVEYHTALDAFPMIPNGGDIELQIAEPGIFRL
jgi:hypothetical protein